MIFLIFRCSSKLPPDPLIGAKGWARGEASKFPLIVLNVLAGGRRSWGICAGEALGGRGWVGFLKARPRRSEAGVTAAPRPNETLVGKEKVRG